MKIITHLHCLQAYFLYFQKKKKTVGFSLFINQKRIQRNDVVNLKSHRIADIIINVLKLIGKHGLGTKGKLIIFSTMKH